MNLSPSDMAADEMFVDRPATYEELTRGYEVMRDACRDAQDGWNAERRKLWATEACLRDLVRLLADTGFHNSIEMAAARKLLAQAGIPA